MYFNQSLIDLTINHFKVVLANYSYYKTLEINPSSKVYTPQ